MPTKNFTFYQDHQRQWHSGNSSTCRRKSGAQEKITLEDQASMLRCSDVREARHTYSQWTESEKAKFQTPSTSNAVRNYVKHNSIENVSQDLVHLTKSDTASASLISESEEREEIAKLQIHLHLHLYLHWRELRNSLTLQNPKVTI